MYTCENVNLSSMEIKSIPVIIFFPALNVTLTTTCVREFEGYFWYRASLIASFREACLLIRYDTMGPPVTNAHALPRKTRTCAVRAGFAHLIPYRTSKHVSLKLTIINVMAAFDFKPNTAYIECYSSNSVGKLPQKPQV